MIARRLVVRAPGRVNLIGEHTDYTGGLVMPVAIQLTTTVSLTPRGDHRLVMHSESVGETVEVDLAQPLTPRRSWSDYVVGVAKTLQDEGYALGGADLLIQSTVPCGAGLSSSAALEVAVGFAMLSAAGAPIDPVSLARWCQRAENTFVGARCGIMDQYVACLGVAGHALLVDCQSLDSRVLPIPSGTSIVVLNTMVRHANASGEYNARREDCETATAQLACVLPNGATLRDVTLGNLSHHGSVLEPRVLKRAHHVVSENQRVLAAADALDHTDLATFGRLMAESHGSLRDDFAVSCPELDVMVELAASEPGVFGTRMTGGGFGGCTVSLVRSAGAESFVQSMQRRYAEATRTRPDAWICVPSGGVEEVGADR